MLGVIGGPMTEEPTKEFNFKKNPLIQQAKLLAFSQESLNLSNNSVASLEQNDEQPDFMGYYIIDQDSLINQNLTLTSIRPDRAGVLIYTVQKGDTLLAIAAEFGISLNSVVWANNIKNETIFPGQELVILPVSGVIHEVKAGETLEEIASLYSADIQKIIDFNNLKGSLIKPGQTLVVPDGKMPYSQKILRQTTYQPQLPSYPNYYVIPTTGINWGILHPVNAVDIANRCGTPVIAAAEGLIVEATWDNGYGTYIKIQHPNGTETLYGHLSKVFVKEGDYVLQDGQSIGLIGNTGYVKGATGCHLHFEVRGAKNPFCR